MSFQFRPSAAADETQILRLLADVFQLRPESSCLEPALFRWKYWSPRTDSPEPRSFVAEQDGRILAHVGVWPLTLRTEAGLERGAHMLDWAADPKAAGCGVMLLQHLMRSHDFLYAIGGSEITRSILPRFGFSAAGQAATFARPLRPWRQIFHHPRRDARLPARLVRNLWWSSWPAASALPGWTWTELRDAGGEALAEREGAGLLFRYLRDCPSAAFRAFQIQRGGRREGTFALAVVGSQARLAGVWLRDPTPEHWRVAFLFAQQAALRESGALELVARSAGRAAIAAAPQAGMRLRVQSPVYLFRKAGGGSPLPIDYQLCDNDSVFHPGSGPEFLT